MTTNKVEPKFSQLREELDSLLQRLQSDELDIDEAIELYQRGLELIKEMENYLKSADNTIQELKAKFDVST